MNPTSPLDVVIRVAVLLDELNIDYVIGGSFGASFFGEPRATANVDIALRLDVDAGERLIARAGTEFYVPTASARSAILRQDSFNLIDSTTSFKVDLFVLGSGLLDRRLSEPESAHRLWTPPNGLPLEPGHLSSRLSGSRQRKQRHRDDAEHPHRHHSGRRPGRPHVAHVHHH